MMNVGTAAAPYGSRNGSGAPIRLKAIVLGSAGAGKTSILRRYHNNTFEYGRRSTLGADFYSKRIPNPAFGKKSKIIANGQIPTAKSLCDNGTSSTSASAASLRSMRSGSSGSGMDSFATNKASQQEPDHAAEVDEPEWDESLTAQQHISLQMWDTAGRERFVSGNAGSISSTLGDAFFQHADCAILVYDATSSRSFTQLLRWYAELTGRMKDYEQNGDGNGRFPVIVVANKLDIIRSDEDDKNLPMRRRKVPQRDIMNLTNGFKGKDHRYEYTVSSLPKTRSRADTGELLDGRNRRHAHNQHHRKQSSLSYGLTDANWTTDNSYLNNIIKSEDGSFPDRDMVILWCMKNGLQHVEVSALDGDGIGDAVQTMVMLAMEAKNEQKKKERLQRQTADGAETFLQEYWASRGYGDEDGVGAGWAKGPALDLTARYTPKDDRCACCWRWRIIPFC